MSVIGVLALQGGYEAHQVMLNSLGAKSSLIRTADELDSISGLIIPGGESSTMLKLISPKMASKIVELNQNQVPIFGTCAGSILLSRHVIPEQFSFGFIDATVVRNGYGRQVDSFSAQINTSFSTNSIEAVFIRAPIVKSYSHQVQCLADVNNNPVLLEQDNILIATFHPELTTCPAIHNHFLEKVEYYCN